MVKTMVSRFSAKNNPMILYGDTPFPHPSHWVFILEPMVTTGDGCTPGKFMQVDPMQQLSPMHGTVSGGCSKRFSSVINYFNDFKVLENMPKICKYCSKWLLSLLLSVLLLILSKSKHILHPNHSHTGFCLGSEICLFCNTFATRTNLNGCSNQVNPEAIKHFYTVGWISPAQWISPIHFCFFGLAFDALHFTVPTWWFQEISKKYRQKRTQIFITHVKILKSYKKQWTKQLTSNICVHLVYIYV